MANEPPLLVEQRGALGIITLNRPEALNVITLDMIRGIDAALTDFAANPAVGAVLIQANGRAFSAGGDVYTILSHPPGPEFERYRRAYFAAEYALDHRIHIYPKPYIAIIDGVTMGGGCGLSLHGRFIIATDRTLVSMPEMAIGHFTDAGATAFLNRAPGEMGIYLGLRGLRINGADAVALRLATHYVPADSVLGLVDALAHAPGLDAAAVEATLRVFARDPGPSAIASRQARVDELFGGSTVEAIVAALQPAKEGWARAALDALRAASPRSLKVTLRMLREGRRLTIAEAMRLEYRVCVRVTGSPDFREGVRAVLIDKDNAARWEPDRLESVSDADVAAYFAPLAPAEPELDLGIQVSGKP